jgi:hypothetical protein
MSFIAPWFLLGGLAVAAPVLFHLIRRSARARMLFGSILFLRPTPPRAVRRRKLEHVALLLLRCLGILLLAAGFARPLFPKGNVTSSSAGEGRQTVVLLDTSASMRRQSLWPKARAVAGQYLEKASLQDRVAVLTFDQQPRTLVSFTEWSAWPVGQRLALARQRLEAVSPGWGGTHLGLALTTAAEQFPDDASPAGVAGLREVVLISDLQEGARLDGLQGHDWPKGVRVIIERVDPERRGNAGLEMLDAAMASAGDGRAARARVVNAGDSARENFLMGWSAEGRTDFAGKPAQIYLPPGQTRTFSAPALPPGAATGTLRLTGDDEGFDNAAYFAAPEMERVTIAYFGSESANDPEQLRYYLQRAFPETARRQVEVVSAISNSVFSLETLNRAALAVIPTRLDADEVKAVREWLAGGKTALLVLTSARSGATIAALTGTADVEVSEASGDYALFGEVDFTHPIFAPFADPRFSDFSRIHVWKHRCWTIPPDLPARVLARFDDGTPALAEIKIGKGSLLALTAGWNPADSQLAVSSKFLPLMQIILDWGGGAAPARCQFQTGEPIPSPVSSGDVLQWRKPDGRIVGVAAGRPFTETDLPGIYTVQAGSRLRRFAVNLPLDESRTAPLSPDDFARVGVPLVSTAGVTAARSPEAAQRHLQRMDLEARQKVWRWLIVLLLAVALVEIALGGWLGRRVKTLEVAP